jgi:uncharacterized protein YndB with AHSA1/START domain
MATIRHHVLIDAPEAKVYQALSTAEGISTWWDKQTPTQTDRGLVLEHNPGPEHGVVQLRVIELVPNKRVEWECISTHPKTSPASAWTGTHVIFEITERERMAILDFRHSGWDENSEYFGFCNYGWGVALQKLQQLCESQ